MRPSASEKPRFGSRARVIGALLALVALLALAGCNPSETITQLIYDQNPDSEVDKTQVILVNDPDAEETSDSLPKIITVQEDQRLQGTVEETPQYGGDTSDAPVDKPVGDNAVEGSPRADSGSKAEEGSSSPTDAPGQRKESKPDANDGADDIPDDEEDNKDDDKDEEPKKNDEEEEPDLTPDFEGDDDKGDQAGDEGDNPDFQGDNQDESGSGKNSKNKKKVYKDYGEFPEIPEEIKHVTAVGQAAVIVSMLGGTEDDTPLVGADAALLDNEEVQKVLAARGISKVQKVWDNDGTAEGDLTDVQDIIALDPELCFVTEGDDTLTEEQEEALVAADILVYVLPSMASASKITYAVQLVGEILEKGGNEQAGQRAKDYIEFHDALVSDIATENGGLTGGFDYNTGREVATGSDPLYSLYISDWDYNARYDDPTGYIETPEGVGAADIGYEEHPVSYYMSVGGVSNTAATGVFRVLSGHTAPVWQFSLSQMPCTWSNWQKINRSKVTYELKGNGFVYALLWADEDDGYGLGTEEFPGVIVATQEMKAAMEREALRSRGAYFPYPATTSTRGGVVNATMVGFDNGDNLVAACIGTRGSGLQSVLNSGDGDVGAYDIHVNPHGLFSSWTDGSVESVLEAAWVYKTFRNESYDLDSQVRAFYRDFYGYELDESDELTDELTAILKGKVS